MKTQSPDTSPEAERVLIDLLRQAGPRRRFEMARNASLAARQLAWNGLCSRHPQAGEAELARRYAALVLGEELATRMFAEEIRP